jgi:hypothetical protein
MEDLKKFVEGAMQDFDPAKFKVDWKPPEVDVDQQEAELWMDDKNL